MQDAGNKLKLARCSIAATGCLFSHLTMGCHETVLLSEDRVISGKDGIGNRL